MDQINELTRQAVPFHEMDELQSVEFFHGVVARCDDEETLETFEVTEVAE